MTDRPGRSASPAPDRRRFLTQAGSAVGATWLLSMVPLLQACGEAARDAADTGAPLRFFTRDQYDALEALTARIIPTDETPGAREAGVARFVDQVFADNVVPGFDQGVQATLEMADGLAAQQGAAGVAALDDAGVDAVLEAISSDPNSPYMALFAVTMMGMFANPEYGGNADELGWRLMGFERAGRFHPPFGHYDRLYRENGGTLS